MSSLQFGGFPVVNITQILVDQARQRPDALAIVESAGEGKRALTFAKLADRSARAAALLRSAGLRNGDRVLVFQPMSIELYTALLAIFRLGLVAAVLDPTAGRGHIEQCCDIARPKAFIGPARAHILRFLCRGLRRIERHFVTAGWAPWATHWSTLERFEALDSITPCNASHDALLTFTSGSTGIPKAAVRSHGFLLAQHEALAESIELEAGEVDLPTLPIFVLANLASGVTTVIPRGDLRRPGFIDPEPILAQLERHRVTRTVGSPALYARLLHGARGARVHNARGHASPELRSESGESSLGTLEKLYTGGAPVFPPFLQELRSALPKGRVIVVYGSTEAEPIAHLDWNEVEPADLDAMYAGMGLLVGEPVRQVDLRILPNRWGEPLQAMTAVEFAGLTLSPKQGGEIVVSGPHVLGGYLNGVGNKETKFRVEGVVWHRTGDAGYLDARGRLWLLGRAGAVIRDERGTIYPFAAECAASQLPWIERSALASRNGERVLVVQLAPRAPADAALRVEETLCWAQLDRIVRLPRIPVDRRHNAKVDYPQLEKELDRYGH